MSANGQGATATNNSYKIGLMYVNDYGYAASNNYWQAILNNYKENIDWMQPSSDEWTISRGSESSTNSPFLITGSGAVAGYDPYNANSLNIRPVFYLVKNAKLDISNMSDENMGTITNPYMLSM